MTLDEVCDAALARCQEFSPEVPTARTPMWHRVDARQQQLFSLVADLDPEYYGRTALVVLAGGAADLSTLTPKAERTTRVEIGDPGTSAYVTGEVVYVVPVMDARELAPRVTLRDNVLTQVGTDLANVTSLRVYYSKRAASLTNGPGSSTIEFVEQFQELLVIDLAKHLLRKMLRMDPESRAAAIALLDEEEKATLADLGRHVEHWRFAEATRFAHSQQAQPRPIA